MKVTLLALVAAALVAASWLTITPVRVGPRVPVPPSTGQEQRQAVVVSHELPAILADEGGTLKHLFKVANESDMPVEITSVRPSCTCSRATISSGVLKPMESADLTIEADLSTRRGAQVFRCTLFDSKANLFGEYTLRTTIYPRVSLSAGEVAFGSVELFQEAQRRVDVEFRDRNKLRLPTIVGITSDAPVTTIAQEAMLHEHDGIWCKTVTINCRLAPQQVAGFGQSKLVAVFESENKRSESSWPISWQIRSLFQVTPVRIFWGNLVPDAGPVERTVRLTRRDGAPFEVRRALCGEHAVTCRVRPRPGGVEICAILDPRNANGYLTGDIRVETNQSDQAVILIPFAAKVGSQERSRSIETNVRR
jgi:hypothetical protein